MNGNLCKVLLAAGVVAASAAAQSSWRLEGGRARARIAGASAAELSAGVVVRLGAGDHAVHFPNRANGKPQSLQFAVPDGASVVLGVEPAGPAPRRGVTIDGEGAFAGTLTVGGRDTPIHVQTTGAADTAASDYRLSATVTATDGCEMFALVARHHAEQGCYLFAIDWRAGKVRLERVMGGDHFVVREADVPKLGEKHTLTLQVHGFRIEGLVDDAPLVRSFDGAISQGAPGVAWSGERPEVGEVWLEEPAEPLASAALVQAGGRATLHASVPQHPSGLAIVELRLDRPHRWVPRSPGGFEPWLRQPFAAPVIAWGDWRGSLGGVTITEVGFDGEVSIELRLPDLPALRLQAALLRLLIATPDGDAIVGATPSVGLRL
ncbi:MAG: hypothetical protein KAI24_10005 [Planctomycetes bacterium]|nr:hypothetical protein [Planctomycetota bacterium]